MRFDIVGQLPLEIIAWLRNVFDLEQQVVTSALTLKHSRTRNFASVYICALTKFQPYW